MTAKDIMKIFEETAYVRMGGSPEELRVAEYLRDKAAKLGLTAQEVVQREAAALSRLRQEG